MSGRPARSGVAAREADASGALAAAVAVDMPDPSAMLPGRVDPPTADLVFSILACDAGLDAAGTAVQGLRDAFVDLHEVRVALPGEIADAAGCSLERAGTLRRALGAAYASRHRVSIAGLLERPARAGRPDLQDLLGVPRFVVDRVRLLHADGRDVPIDDRLLAALKRAGVVGGDADAAAAAERALAGSGTDDPRLAYARVEGLAAAI
ncbi:MAG: hypothetical protein AAFX79_12470 [Planctomycetota bacterium]